MELLIVSRGATPVNRKAIRHLAAGVVALLLLIDSATAQYEYLGSLSLIHI